MHKHRIFIIVAAALAVISTFLPWGSFNAGAIGSFSVSGIQAGHGWFIIILSIGAIVLACLPNIATPMNKNFSIGVIVIGVIESILSLVNMINVGQYAISFGDYGVSIGFGLILTVLASIATVITGLLAMSGGKITKGTFQELASTGRGFAQSVASSVQSPQQPGQPGQQQWQQPQQGFGKPAPGQGFQQAPQQPQPGFQQAPQQPQPGFQQAPQQPQQGFQQAPQQPQQGFQQAPQQPQQGFQQAPQQPQQGFQQAPQQPQQGFQQAPQQPWQPQQPEQPTTEPGQE